MYLFKAWKYDGKNDIYTAIADLPAQLWNFACGAVQVPNGEAEFFVAG